MGIADIVVLALLGAWAVGAAVWIIRRRASGKTCCGNCRECGGCQKSKKDG